MTRFSFVLISSFLVCGLVAAHAESGREAWLRYAPLDEATRARYATLPASVLVLGNSPIIQNAQNELVTGVRGMMGHTLRLARTLPTEPAIVLGTVVGLRELGVDVKVLGTLGEEGFWLGAAKIKGLTCLVIASPSERGVLYGTFTLLRKIAAGASVQALNEIQQPGSPIRWVDQWDNLNGSIERGYGGRSIFFDNDAVRADMTRVSEYARLLASIGINGVAINNVNANPKVLTADFLPQLVRVAEVFRPWGIRLSVSVDVSSPKAIGGLDSFDPIDPQVIVWWKRTVDGIYGQIPDFGGFVVKADSEGRPGPSSYGRTPADAANVIARALKPHGGILFYRAFVYNHHLDWNDPKNDRGRAAYDIFHPLDGKFDDNVIIQIKHGPIDFQAREPVSPLFGGLEKTNAAVELQVTQEYTGQQKHLCFLIPMWKEVLDFDLRVGGKPTVVKDVLTGKRFHRPLAGYIAVVNVGLDANWLGHPLAMANLYGYGRLAWNANLSAATIADEWTRLSFGNDPVVVKTVSDMQLTSWHIYESYTGFLGSQTLTDILGSHYGPGIESSERNGWGQWHRADEKGIGMDRTVATGTGFVGQYAPEVAMRYESLKTTSDDLVLFFHHVPYTYVLHSGKTVIQHVYDSHYEGGERAAGLARKWKSLKGRIDDERYAEILQKLEYQAGHAIVWRDAICSWFLRESKIADAKGRAGHFPDRIEAEAMQLVGYKAADVTPWENVSGGKAVRCDENVCSVAFPFHRTPGWYELDLQYFDQNNGESKFRVFVGSQLVDEWTADAHLPAFRIGGDSSTRRRIRGLALRPGDEIRIEGMPQGAEPAVLDYVEVLADRPAMRPSTAPKPH